MKINQLSAELKKNLQSLGYYLNEDVYQKRNRDSFVIVDFVAYKGSILEFSVTKFKNRVSVEKNCQTEEELISMLKNIS